MVADEKTTRFVRGTALLQLMRLRKCSLLWQCHARGREAGWPRPKPAEGRHILADRAKTQRGVGEHAGHAGEGATMRSR